MKVELCNVLMWLNETEPLVESDILKDVVLLPTTGYIFFNDDQVGRIINDYDFDNIEIVNSKKKCD